MFISNVFHIALFHLNHFNLTIIICIVSQEKVDSFDILYHVWEYFV